MPRSIKIRWIVKTDDDIVVDWNQLSQKLQRVEKFALDKVHSTKNNISATKFSNGTVNRHIKYLDGNNNNCTINTNNNNCIINKVFRNSDIMINWNDKYKSGRSSICSRTYNCNAKEINISNAFGNNHSIKEVANVDINDTLFCHIVFRNFRPTRKTDDKL